MPEFKTDKLWIVFQSYSCYSPLDLIVRDNENDAREIAKRMNRKCLSLNCYLENKEAYDREVGYGGQSRVDNGLYADPYDE